MINLRRVLECEQGLHDASRAIDPDQRQAAKGPASIVAVQIKETVAVKAQIGGVELRTGKNQGIAIGCIVVGDHRGAGIAEAGKEAVGPGPDCQRVRAIGPEQKIIARAAVKLIVV